MRSYFYSKYRHFKVLINFVFFKLRYQIFRIQPYSFFYFGLKIFYPKGHFIVNSIAKGDDFEKEEIKILNNLVDSESVIIDCGANIGLISCSLVKKIDSGHIYAFEPSPTPYKCLVKTITYNKLDEFITPVQEACSNVEAKMNFYSHGGVNCAYDGIYDTGRAGSSEKIIVKCTTIDSFVVKQNLKRVDIIKIDTEGYEMQVIMGAKQTLYNFKPVIIFEAHPVNMAACGVNVKDFYSLLKDFKYDVKTLNGKTLSSSEFEEEVEIFKDNFLAVHREKYKCTNLII